MVIEKELLTALGVLATLWHLFGLWLAADALLRTRTAQGAIAWALSLAFFPYLSVPLYLVFGRNKFRGYSLARRAGDERIQDIVRGLTDGLPHHRHQPNDEREFVALEALSRAVFTRGNRLQLLIDGEATFEAIFRGIEAAQNYLLVQFFIIHDDELGRQLQRRLIEQAKRGCRVYLLYDEVGSHKLPQSYLEPLRAAGVQVRPFYTRKGFRNRFQLNFRNHRKIVIVDGREAFVGGHNVGDEYLGRNRKLGPWRDTHVRIVGPAVQAVQVAFLEDWYWSTDDVLSLEWRPRAAPSDDVPADNARGEGDDDARGVKNGADQAVLAVRSGPADDWETCGLFFVEAINMAKRRLWISSPYFVPDEPVVAALRLAALRGVDVKVLLPDRADHLLVYLSAFSYIAEIGPIGVEFYRYQAGFLHQKALLVDDRLAAVGTANLDNRSIRLNFELTVAAADERFAAEVARMLQDDLARSRLAAVDDLSRRSWWFRVAVRIARLTAPVQ